MQTAANRWTPVSPSQALIAVIFVVAGSLHFLIAPRYVAIMPPALPHPLLLVQLSGLAELAGGAGVLHRKTRRAAGIGLMLLLAAVFPANVQMLLNAVAAGKPAWWIAALCLRLPLQGVLIWWVWRSTRR